MTTQRREGHSGDSAAAPHWPIDRTHGQTAAAAATAAKARPAVDCAEAADDGATNAAVTSGAGAGVSCGERVQKGQARGNERPVLQPAATISNGVRPLAVSLRGSRRQQRPASSARATLSGAGENAAAQQLQSKEWAAMGAVWGRQAEQRSPSAAPSHCPSALVVAHRASRLAHPHSTPPLPSPPPARSQCAGVGLVSGAAGG